MSRVQLKAPKLSSDELEPCDLSEIELRPEADWSHLTATGTASGIARDAIFDEIEWRAARLGAANWERATWRDCRIKGLLAAESDWNDVEFRNCNLSGAHLRFSRWKLCRFYDCDLGGSDWTNADARGLVFHNCDLRGANFNFAQLGGTDWRTCQTEKLQINDKALKGLICEPLQAAQFARVLGLDVRWD